MRVAVVEDQLLTREGIVRTLTAAGQEVVAEAGDVPALMRALALDRPDAVILDVRLPPTYTIEGLRAAGEIRRRHPEVAVLVLSQYVEAEFALELLEQGTGGVGYLLKDRIVDHEMLVDGLRRVAAGQCVLDPSMVADLLRYRADPGPFADLTDRERDVLQGIAEGLTNRAIGERLSISERTVEVHAQRVFAKLGVAADPGINRRVLAAVRHLTSPNG